MNLYAFMFEYVKSIKAILVKQQILFFIYQREEKHEDLCTFIHFIDIMYKALVQT